ncbi:unnamed protein product [Anisakis simplex]|uniref:GLOBIN domain-containing protein n=1 Tax=Anisakis simplex TaxID=6269 RepID=A0A0M3JXF7_ANISI|nr:unnamed protein product [Anisakis simplex]
MKEVFGVPTFIDDLFEYEPFRRSGKLLGSVIDLCVRNIDELDAEMGPVLVMYGRRHYHRYTQGFHLKYVPIFVKCMSEFVDANINEGGRTTEIEGGWHSLFDYIASKIVEGVHLERHRNHSTRRKSVF